MSGKTSKNHWRRARTASFVTAKFTREVNSDILEDGAGREGGVLGGAVAPGATGSPSRSKLFTETEERAQYGLLQKVSVAKG